VGVDVENEDCVSYSASFFVGSFKFLLVVPGT
jgi:hypothetical protein